MKIEPFVQSHIVIAYAFSWVEDEECEVWVDKGIPRLLKHILQHVSVEWPFSQIIVSLALGLFEACSVHYSYWNIKQLGYNKSIKYALSY